MKILRELFAVIEERKKATASQSYTATLLNDQNLAAQKVGEEATEVIIAALNQSRERLVEESADLLYHLLVLIASRNVTLDELEAELRKRRK